MPSLKIASIDPEEPGYSSREKRYAKYQAMARSNADIILMPESAASEIQLSPDNDRNISQRVAALYKLEKIEADGTEREKELAAARGLWKTKNGKTNLTITFEDFGCDCLVVDEAHRYKNLFSSSLSRETGMNDGRQSAKAMALYKKSEYIREKNNGKNVFLLTATPLTNSPLYSLYADGLYSRKALIGANFKPFISRGKESSAYCGTLYVRTLLAGAKSYTNGTRLEFADNYALIME